MKIFTPEWAAAYKEALNNSEDYRKASTRWKAGPIALVMLANEEHGYPKNTAVWLDLHEGVCQEAESLSAKDAFEKSTFVIEGNYDNWIKVLSGEAQPLMMLMRGKLKLRKGSLAALMPFTKSAQELVKAAQTISDT